MALERRFGQLNGAKLALERRFGWPGGAKLALERRLGRPGGAMLALERRFGCPWTPSGLWNDVLGRPGRQKEFGRSEAPGANFV